MILSRRVSFLTAEVCIDVDTETEECHTLFMENRMKLWEEMNLYIWYKQEDIKKDHLRQELK